MTAILSLIVMASVWSCVTYTKVIDSFVWSSLRALCMATLSLKSRAPKGSSSRSAFGSFTRARARAIRCLWPPESWLEYLCSKPVHVHEFEHAHDLFMGLSARDLPHPQRVVYVLVHVHVREYRVILEDRVHVPVVGRHSGDILAGEEYRTPGGRFETRDHPEGRRLSAPGRARAGKKTRRS